MMLTPTTIALIIPYITPFAIHIAKATGSALVNKAVTKITTAIEQIVIKRAAPVLLLAGSKATFFNSSGNNNTKTDAITKSTSNPTTIASDRLSLFSFWQNRLSTSSQVASAVSVGETETAMVDNVNPANHSMLLAEVAALKHENQMLKMSVFGILVFSSGVYVGGLLKNKSAKASGRSDKTMIDDDKEKVAF